MKAVRCDLVACRMPLVRGKCPFRRWHDRRPCPTGRALVGAAKEVAAEIDCDIASRPLEQLIHAGKAAVKHLKYCSDCQRRAM